MISSVEVAYPQSADVRVVQRLLHEELLGVEADATRRRAWRNAAVAPLLLPLMLTPLSNVPIYWIGWRAWTQMRASANSVAARDFLRSSSRVQRFAADDDATSSSCSRSDDDAPAASDGDTVCCRVESTGAGPRA